ncbi:MAG: NlpC/P60 family protein, partial [Rectinema sp.]
MCFFLLFLALAFQPAFGVVSAPPLLGLASSSARQSVLNAAESYLGVPYRFGGSTKSGIDCSGLVYVSYLQATGIKIPRTVDTLARWSLVIPVGELEPGDLVFFDLQAKGGASSAQAPTS